MEKCKTCDREHRSNSCPQCRANERAIARGEKIGRCQTCKLLSALRTDGNCKKCLALNGFKECGTCREVKSAFMEFNGRQRHCKACVQKKRKPTDLTTDEFNIILAKQEGRCAICKTKTKMVKDHDHATNQFRGLLCRQCNSGIGLFYDSTKNLKSAIEYLEFHRSGEKLRGNDQEDMLQNLMVELNGKREKLEIATQNAAETIFERFLLDFQTQLDVLANALQDEKPRHAKYLRNLIKKVYGFGIQSGIKRRQSQE